MKLSALCKGGCICSVACEWHEQLRDRFGLCDDFIVRWFNPGIWRRYPDVAYRAAPIEDEHSAVACVVAFQTGEVFEEHPVELRN